MISRPHVPRDQPVVLFSYGTLQQPQVQDTVLGHRPQGWPDSLPHHRLEWITITDRAVVDLSGTDRHPMLVADPTAEPVEGTAWHLTGNDLASTDDYEVDSYRRIEVTLASGTVAWVYTLDPDA